MKRNNKITLSLSDIELNKINTQAFNQHIPLAVYIRQQMLIICDEEELKKIE